MLGLGLVRRPSLVVTRALRTYPALPQVTVGCVVLREGPRGKYEAMLVERKNDPAKNTFAFPGGRLDLGESLVDCARREVKEETNVDLDPSFPVSARSKWQTHQTTARGLDQEASRAEQLSAQFP